MCFIYAFIEIRNGQQLGISPNKKKKKKTKKKNDQEPYLSNSTFSFICQVVRPVFV